MAIENELQLEVTKREAKRFEDAIAALSGEPEGWVRDVQLKALGAQLDDLKAEIEAWEVRKDHAAIGLDRNQ